MTTFINFVNDKTKENYISRIERAFKVKADRNRTTIGTVFDLDHYELTMLLGTTKLSFPIELRMKRDDVLLIGRGSTLDQACKQLISEVSAIKGFHMRHIERVNDKYRNGAYKTSVEKVTASKFKNMEQVSANYYQSIIDKLKKV